MQGQIVVFSVHNERPQRRDDLKIAPLRQQTTGGAGMPVIRMRQQFHQFAAAQFGQIKSHRRRGRAVRDAEDAAVGPIPSGVGVRMRRAGVVPVGDIDAAVRAQTHVTRREPGIVRPQQLAAVSRAK